MKNIRKIVCTWYFCIPFAALFFLEGCSKGNGALFAPSNDYTGEQIFRAIFFGQGEAAKLIPNYSIDLSAATTTTEEKLSLEKLEDNVVKTINENDPAFFSNFEKSVKSGNLVSVKQAIAMAIKNIRRCYISDTEINETKVNAELAYNISEKLKKEDKNLKPVDAIKLLRTNKYKDLVKQVYAPMNVTSKKSSNPQVMSSVSVNTSVTWDTNTAIYKYVAAVVAGVLVLVLFLGETDTSGAGENYFTNLNNNQLYQQQMVAAVAETFHKQ